MASNRRSRKDENGDTGIEYGLIAALLAVACIVGLEATSGSLSGMFGAVKEMVEAQKGK